VPRGRRRGVLSLLALSGEPNVNEAYSWSWSGGAAAKKKKKRCFFPKEPQGGSRWLWAAGGWVLAPAALGSEYLLAGRLDASAPCGRQSPSRSPDLY
jgi:hypothetical protein